MDEADLWGKQMHSQQGGVLLEPKKEKGEVIDLEKVEQELIVPEKEREDSDSKVLSPREASLQNPEVVVPLRIETVEDECPANDSNQLIVYDPTGHVSSFSDPSRLQIPNCRKPSGQSTSNRVLPSIGTFTVQCAACLKWRVIPTKEEYEAIRETILEDPFICEHAKKWRPNICCDDPQDLEPDQTRIWAIDKPNISQPPPGWQRLLRIRGEGSTKFADVYYVAPTGKRLRSMVEVQRFLLDNPEYMHAGVSLSQFSYQIPKPLNDGYVRKRNSNRAGFALPGGGVPLGLPGPLDPAAVNPIAWAGPPTASEMEGNMIPTSYLETSCEPIQKKAKPSLN